MIITLTTVIDNDWLSIYDYQYTTKINPNFIDHSPFYNDLDPNFRPTTQDDVSAHVRASTIGPDVPAANIPADILKIPPTTS